MSDTLRVPWKEVWPLPIIEFLNIICYRKDKAEDEKRQIEEWKRKMH